MKLIIEIRKKDGKTQTHICNDFVGWGNDFITLYKEGFVREYIRTETVEHVKQYFKK